MVMCEIWSLGKKLLPQLSPPQVHGIIIDHWISICVCSLLEVHMKFVISHYILYNFYIAIIYYIAALGDLVPAFLLFLFYCFPLDAICIYFLKAVYVSNIHKVLRS